MHKDLRWRTSIMLLCTWICNLHMHSYNYALNLFLLCNFRPTRTNNSLLKDLGSKMGGGGGGGGGGGEGRGAEVTTPIPESHTTFLKPHL